MLVENLSSKPAEFYLIGIKLPDKWQEVIQNNEYTIDWNLFIVKSFVNELYISSNGNYMTC